MNVDGLILSATHLSDAHRKLLSQIDIPVVVVAQNYPDGICIINDDYYVESSSAPTSDPATTARSPACVWTPGMKRSASSAARASWTA
ncbi:MAG: hypothetical protein ACLVJ6_14205 [Merdibacter sp.]